MWGLDMRGQRTAPRKAGGQRAGRKAPGNVTWGLAKRGEREAAPRKAGGQGAGRRLQAVTRSGPSAI
eukprot:6692092-Prorocentrum_lima.AAC.1